MTFINHNVSDRLLWNLLGLSQNICDILPTDREQAYQVSLNCFFKKKFLPVFLFHSSNLPQTGFPFKIQQLHINQIRCVRACQFAVSIIHAHIRADGDESSNKQKTVKMSRKLLLREIWPSEEQIPSPLMSLKACYGFAVSQFPQCRTLSQMCQLYMAFYCSVDKISRLKGFFFSLLCTGTKPLENIARIKKKIPKEFLNTHNL